YAERIAAGNGRSASGQPLLGRACARPSEASRGVGPRSALPERGEGSDPLVRQLGARRALPDGARGEIPSLKRQLSAAPCWIQPVMRPISELVSGPPKSGIRPPEIPGAPVTFIQR